MIILDIAKELQENYGYDDIPITDLADVIRDTFAAIPNLLIKKGKDSSIKIPRFGNFKLVLVPPHIGFNPRKQEKINVPAKYTLRFRLSPTIRAELSAIKIPKGVLKEKSSSKKKKKKK